MGNPAIFSGRRTKTLTADGLLLSSNAKIDNDGIVNYITNGHAEANTTGWATYADTPSERPIDGTGGSPNVTWTRVTTSPLAGQASFLFTKDAADREGQGASYTFNINASDQAKVLDIELDYIVASGTFNLATTSDGSDLIVYIYDVTNATLIEPSSISFLSNSTTISDTFRASFQTASNSTQYRLIFHVTNGGVNAYTIKFDDIRVSPSRYVTGTPITDWQSYTPTISHNAGSATNYTNSARWRRVGDSIEVNGGMVFSSTSSSFTDVNVSIPSGLSIDLNKAVSSSLGRGMIIDAGVNFYPLHILYATTTYVTIFVGNASSTYLGSSSITQAVPITFNTNDSISYFFSAPITGWSSSVQMSDQTDTRVVDFTGTITTAVLTGNTTNIPATTVKDSHSAWISNQYSVPVAGDYVVSLFAYSVATGFVSQAYVNGTKSKSIAWHVTNAGGGGSVILPNLKTGDIISVRSNVNATLASDNDQNINIERISGPSAIAASETVAMIAFKTSAQTLTTGVYGTVAGYDAATFDTHGGFNSTSGVYTFPTAGIWEVTATTAFVSNSTGIRHNLILKNGALYQFGTLAAAATGDGNIVTTTTLMRAVAGDTTAQQGYQTSGGNLDVRALASSTALIVKRIGL